MDFVKHYDLATDNDIDFKVKFSIPDNCDYSYRLLDAEYRISVELRRGQTEPSTDYIEHEVEIEAIDDTVSVVFEQNVDSVWKFKPKMKVDNCG
jgi:hypothetical protein